VGAVGTGDSGGIQSLVENGTWIRAGLSVEPSSTHGKWVSRSSVEPLRDPPYKARWSSAVFEQKEGLDFHELRFCGKAMSLQAIFALAAAYDWEIEQMDVKTAFLYGDIDEDIWIELPTAMVSGTAKLRKALYG